MKIIKIVDDCNFEKLPYYYGFGRRKWDMACNYYYIFPLWILVRIWERLIRIYYRLINKSKLGRKEKEKK